VEEIGKSNKLLNREGVSPVRRETIFKAYEVQEKTKADLKR